MEKTTSFLKHQPTEEEYKRGKSEALGLGFIIGWAVTSSIEYLFNIKIPTIIKYFVIISGFSFLFQIFLSKHLCKKITFKKQAQEHNEKLEQKIVEMKNIDDKQSKEGLILSIIIVIIIFFIVAIFFQLSDDKNIKFTQTNKSDSYSESNKAFQGLTLSELGMDDERYGEEIRWEGAFCGLSQIDGIKLCFLDDEGGTDNLDIYNWFWGLPEVVPSVEEHGGEWASWMLKKYGNIDADTLTGDEVFVVTGTFVFNDCNFYDGKDICIPNILVTDIAIK